MNLTLKTDRVMYRGADKSFSQNWWFLLRTNQPTRCSNFSSLLLVV